VDPLRLAWTSATVELYSDEHHMAIHVFNHDLSTLDAVHRTLRFVIARIRWFKLQLPAGTIQGARFDDRGQTLSDFAKRRLREALSPYEVSVVFMSEKGK
jgi:hypothetical protein